MFILCLYYSFVNLNQRASTISKQVIKDKSQDKVKSYYFKLINNVERSILVSEQRFKMKVNKNGDKERGSNQTHLALSCRMQLANNVVSPQSRNRQRHKNDIFDK